MNDSLSNDLNRILSPRFGERRTTPKHIHRAMPRIVPKQYSQDRNRWWLMNAGNQYDDPPSVMCPACYKSVPFDPDCVDQGVSRIIRFDHHMSQVVMGFSTITEHIYIAECECLAILWRRGAVVEEMIPAQELQRGD